MQARDILRQARHGAGLSQAALAARAGTSQAAVARRERGVEEPTLPTLRRLLYACGFVLEVEARRLPPSPRRELLQRERQRILDLLAKRGVRAVHVFGSVARGDDDADSDIDLLVEFEGEHSSGGELLAVLGLTEELGALLGARVDVASEATLEERVRERALSEATAL